MHDVNYVTGFVMIFYTPFQLLKCFVTVLKNHPGNSDVLLAMKNTQPKQTKCIGCINGFFHLMYCMPMTDECELF